MAEYQECKKELEDLLEDCASYILRDEPVPRKRVRFVEKQLLWPLWG